MRGQNVLPYGSWVLTVGLLVVAFRLGRKEKGTPFYVLMVLASMVAACAEPLYDVGFALYFYSTKGMHHTFTAFGIPQPIFVVAPGPPGLGFGQLAAVVLRRGLPEQPYPVGALTPARFGRPARRGVGGQEGARRRPELGFPSRDE